MKTRVRSRTEIIFLIALIILFALCVIATRPIARGIAGMSLVASAAPAAIVPSPYIYDFTYDNVIQEAPSPDQSENGYWWLDSGGTLVIEGGVGKTLHGPLSLLDPWHMRYARSSAIDTEDGTKPQNLLRLLTRSPWENVRAEVSFYISGDNLTDSPNRNQSNGVLLMSRYKDSNNLYYAGVRVDGTAVIKKKYAGLYYTMAQAPIFPGEYARETGANLLPHGEWVRLRVETVTQSDGDVIITLFMRRPGAADWQRLLGVTDDGVRFGGTPPIAGAYPLGIRTDFMDVQFDDFRAENI